MLFNSIFFLGTANRSSFINQFVVVVVVVVQWKAARCRIHLGPAMILYGRAKVLRGVKALQTRKNLLMVLKTYSCKDLQAVLKIFNGNVVVVVVVT